MPNRLAGETSPYLLQHAENPVEWYPWGDEAFAAARQDDKPVLLSVGYSACHWCHVMAHESFEDPETAALMNRLFVNIKVDREERPDVDTVYMQAVQALSGRGGWPMTVFLTPDGTPYFGGTYFPPHARHGMPSFRTILEGAADAYHTRRDAVENAGAQLRAYLEPPAHHKDGGEVTSSHLEAATTKLLDSIDWTDGGFGDAPKFPHAAAIDFLLARWHLSGDPHTLDAAVTCLDRMARGGIFDQVGGGFHRYSVDATWSVPHFEKMLYDNAQLVPVYLHAFQLSGRERWRGVAEATLDYLVREMRLPGGGFAASQDADTPEGEGAFFVWTFDQLRAVLGDEDASLATRLFGVTQPGNFEGATVLSMIEPLDVAAASLGADPAELNVRFASIRERLLAAKSARIAPARDDKVVTAWNALAITAFAQAGATLRRDDYLQVARDCADFLLREVARDGVPLRTWKDGAGKIEGFLEDVSYLASALLTLYEATGETRYYDEGMRLASAIERDFGEGGALYDTRTSADALLVRPRTLDDNPLPAGQSVAAQTYLRLHAFTGDAAWFEKARAIIDPLADGIARSPLAVSTLALAAEALLTPPQEVAISGDAADPRVRELLACAWSSFSANRVIAWGGGDVPLLRDRDGVDGTPAAYVCSGFVCARPVTTAEELTAQLSGAAAEPA